MTQEFIIRTATEKDALDIHHILVKAFAEYKYFYSQEGYEDTVLSEEKAKKRIQQMNIYVAEDKSGEIIGTIGWEKINEKEGHIRGMAVIPERQGKNSPAVKLLEKVEKRARAEGCSFLTLDTTKILIRAHKFYEKNRFTRTGKIGDFFGSEIIEYGKKI
jgi:GNAT superfamily N-acetyltransferase